MSFSENLQNLRKANNISQEQLAERLNVTRQTVSKWETGGYPEIDKIIALCNMFDCTMDELINGTVDANKADAEASSEAEPQPEPRVEPVSYTYTTQPSEPVYNPTAPKKSYGVIIAVILAVAAAMILCATLIVGTIINVRRGLGFWGSTWNYNYPDSGSYTADGEFSVSAAGISDIEIDWIAGNITLIVGDGDEIKVSETSALTDPDDVMRYKVDHGKLIIKFRKAGRLLNSIFLNNTMAKNLTIEIPADVAAGIGLGIDTVSSDIDINTGGEVRDMSFKSIDINTVSGHIYISDVNTSKLDIDTVSGDIVVCGNISSAGIDTVSGDVSFDAYSNPNDLAIDSVSGDIAIGLRDKPKELNIDTVSGSVTVDGDKKKHSYNTEHSSGSGKIDIDTVSGDVNVSTGN